jgi:hypothetical protein
MNFAFACAMRALILLFFVAGRAFILFKLQMMDFTGDTSITPFWHTEGFLFSSLEQDDKEF